MATSALARAKKALEAGNEEAALDALLVAWRASRSPGIATLIDRISEPLAKKDGVVKGKTVKARTEALIAIAADKPSARVTGQLAATPWPGAWADAVPMLEALQKLPPDPRLAMMLAKTVEATPWDSWGSVNFYGPLLTHLTKLRDPRTLEVLEADLQRTKSPYLRRARAKQEAAVKALRGAKSTALSAEDVKELEALAKHFAGDVAKEKAKAGSEDELLAAVYAAPDDDAPRAVYADWLQEQNDPRGEMIALQLSKANAKREATLVNKHASAGPLEKLTDKKGRVYERGFLARARLLLDGPRTPDLDQPAWATVHTLVVGQRTDTLLKILALPSFRGLRRLIGSESELVAKLPSRPALEELDFHLDRTNVESRIAKSKSFPKLRRLGVAGPLDRVKKVLEGPLGKQLEQITHYSNDLGPLVRLVDELGLTNVKEVRVVLYFHAEPDTWRFAMTRDEKGRFTKLHGVRHLRGSGSSTVYDFERVLTSLKPGELTSLTIDRSEPTRLTAGDIRRVEEELARFPGLAHVDVPWPRAVAKKKGAADTTAIPMNAHLVRDKRLDAAGYAKLWAEVTAKPLSLAFDSYSENQGAHKPLGTDGLAAMQHALAKKRTWSLTAYALAGPDRFSLIHSRVNVVGAAEVATYLTWLTKLVDQYGFHGDVAFMKKSQGGKSRLGESWEEPDDLPSLMSFDREPWKWVWILDREVDKTHPFAELEKLPKQKGLGWLRTVRTKKALMLVFGATPADVPTPEQRLAFEQAAFAIFWKTFEKRHGFRPQELVAKAFAPALKKLGFERHSFIDPIDEARGLVAFAASSPKKETRWIFFEPHVAPDDLVLSFHARHAKKKAKADLTMHEQVERSASMVDGIERVKTKAQMQKAVATAVAELASKVAWFDEPDEPKKTRRR